MRGTPYRHRTFIQGIAAMNVCSRLVRKISGRLRAIGMRSISRMWPAHSRLFLVGDSANWSISRDMREVAGVARRLGVHLADPKFVDHCTGQSAIFGCQFQFLLGRRSDTTHRLGFAYYHGKPGTGVPEFDQLYEAFCRQKEIISRVQVSHSEMRDIVLESGIDPTKVFLIPIGINLSLFPVQTTESKKSNRTLLGIPQDAVVVGSFQKDGNGWGDGLEPKLIKGPDVLLDAVKVLRDSVPELFVLLSGPARGFVMAGLEKLRIPYKHLFVDSYEDLWRLYHALDVYLVSSRQEGGPKGVLESMAAGVPLITTRVGQAMDMVKSGVNGWMVDVEDSEGLAYWAEHAVTDSDERTRAIRCARQTAEENSYEAQEPLWHELMNGFVQIGQFR